MKKISLAFILTAFSLFAQNDAQRCVLLTKINALIRSELVQPKPIDDSLLVFVFDSFIDALDPSRNIFLKSEYESLSLKYRLNLDDLIHTNDCSFLSDIVTVYKTGLLRNKAILEKMKTDTIDYNKKIRFGFTKKYFHFIWKKVKSKESGEKK